jgi:hypothetical protein
MPLSEAFWERYAEPVDHFLNAAGQFRQMLEGLTKIGSPETLSSSDAWEVVEARDSLNALLSGVSPVLGLGAKGFDYQWVSYPLLSSLGFMVWLDLRQGKKILICRREGCSNIFVTDRPNREYCSPTCKTTEDKRRYREVVRQAKEMFSQGISVQDIAFRLGREPDLIASWVGAEIGENKTKKP